MKFLISFIIINNLSCLTIAGTPNTSGTATSNANETKQISSGVDDPCKKELNFFLKEIQGKPGITTRIVKTDEGENSINNFFKSSLPSGTTENVTNIWQITNQDVKKTGFLINIVVSCEYSESIYFLVQLIGKAIKNVFNDDISKNRNHIMDFLFKPIIPDLTKMILTLVGLLNCINNYSLKNHEILNILLSWYVYIVNSGFIQKDAESNYQKAFHIDYIPLINNQVETHLKKFILNNCRNVNDYEKFKTAIDGELGNLTKMDDFTSLLTKKLSDLDKLKNTNFLKNKYNINKLHVLNPKSNESLPLRNAMSDQMSSMVINIAWEKNNYGMSYTYDNFISKNASGIKTLLKYEKIILELISRIIMGHLVKELTDLIYDPQLSDTQLYREIQNKFISLLDNYIQQFKNDGQSLYLINYMSIIKSDLWTLCNNNKSFEDKKTEVGKYISKLDKLKLDVSKPSLTKLKQFMDKISGNLIYAILHPSVTNAYWEKMYFAPTKISDYIVDLKHLYRKHEEISENDKTKCTKFSNILGKLKAIERKITVCESEIQSDKSEGLKTCFNELNSQYARLKIKVDDVVSSTDGIFKFNWKKFLLSIVHNIEHVQSFSKHGKDKNKIVKDLKVLHNSTIDYFEVGFFVTCKSEPVYKEENETQIIAPETMLSQAEYREMSRKLVDINSYHDFFKNINELIGKIIERNIEPDLTLYWDGNIMTLKNVYDKYRLYPHDQLQINYDYFKFMVKWFIAAVYSRIVEIAKEIIETDTSDLSPSILFNVCFVDELELMFQEFQNLPLYISMPVSNILGGFVYVLMSYINDSSNDESLNDYINVIKLELEKLDYVPPTTNMDCTFSVNIEMIIDTISDLISIYETHKSAIDNAATTIGMDLNDRTMMHHEWK